MEIEINKIINKYPLLPKKNEKFDRLCICGHWEYQHKWLYWLTFLKLRSCKICQCPKFRSIGKYTLEEGKFLQQKFDVSDV